MNYKHAEETAALLADGLEEIGQVMADQLGLPDEAGKLKVRAEQIRADRFKVVVVGEFKRGKSTLLNALLGADLLPQKVTPCTAVVTVIQYSDKPGVRVLYIDKKSEEALSLAEFQARYKLQTEDAVEADGDGATAEVLDRFSHIDYAVLGYPIELCRHRVELVDSPGLGEHVTRSRRTEAFLNRADAIVMVLDATALLKMEEEHFLDSVLLPRGLKNIFFIVNKWNLIEQSVLRPEDLEANYAELDARIRAKLTPFCVIDGIDRFAERIFRVNALGAVKARLRKPPAASMLEESNIPAFEAALQRFLVEDRGKARADVGLAAMKTASDEVSRFINTQLALAGKTIAELEAEMAAIQPKLDRLRGIKKHIEAFLESNSATLQERLSASFLEHIKTIEDDLPNAVTGFGLADLTQGSMIWKALSDWARQDENKFAKKVERHLTPHVYRYFEKQMARWHQAVVQNEMKAVAVDVEKHLQEEAAEYQRVMREIEDQLGIEHSRVEIKELVERWLGPSGAADGFEHLRVGELGGGVLGDMSWLVVGVVTDITIHSVGLLAPVIGVIITGFRLYLREKNIREDMKRKLVEGLKKQLEEIRHTQMARIRDNVKQGFDGLRQKIGGRIGEEISLVEASLQSIIDRKRDKEYSAEQERARLEEARGQIAAVIARVRPAVSSPHQTARQLAGQV